MLKTNNCFARSKSSVISLVLVYSPVRIPFYNDDNHVLISDIKKRHIYKTKQYKKDTLLIICKQ